MAAGSAMAATSLASITSRHCGHSADSGAQSSGASATARRNPVQKLAAAGGGSPTKNGRNEAASWSEAAGPSAAVTSLYASMTSDVTSLALSRSANSDGRVPCSWSQTQGSHSAAEINRGPGASAALRPWSMCRSIARPAIAGDVSAAWSRPRWAALRLAGGAKGAE